VTLREKKMSLTNEQIAELLKPIDPSRVSKDGKGFSHVEAWDVRRTMNQIFGFGKWSARVDQMELIYEQMVEGAKPRWSVAYRARCTLEVGEGFMDGGGVYAEWAAGDATNYPSRADAHDQAIKTAESQAFKRCAVNLGDQFGLSLYRNGSTEATVGDVVGREHADSGMVEDLVAAFDDAATVGDLEMVAQEISRLDLGREDKDRLRAAYVAAKARVDVQP
jgi:recombination DNA repair RAD52 pathway protein